MDAKLSSLLGNLLPVIKKGLVELRISYKRLGSRVMAQDMLTVTRSVGFVVFPAFLIGLVFLLLPQGRDTLLLVVENMRDAPEEGFDNYFPLLFLLIGLFFWSISSELSVRYSIYISDNSGKNLSDERVYFRKTAQKLLAGIFLLWPYFIVICGFIYNMVDVYIHKNTATNNIFIHFIICIVLVYALMVIVSNLYFEKYDKPQAMKAMRTSFGARSLPAREYFWLQKLYGIYNNYVFSLPKRNNFKGTYKAAYKQFTDFFTPPAPATFREGFPQDPDVLVPLRLVPKEFELIDNKQIIAPEGDHYKWIYAIPLSFYKQLHYRIKRLALISFAVLLIISLIPVTWNLFGCIGAPALICVALGCYSGMYTGLLFLDKGLLRNSRISVRLLLILLFIGSSFYNQDHPVRMDKTEKNEKRIELNDEFQRWFALYKKEIDTHDKDTLKNYPVVFVCAEGGALRTGAYTGLYLTKLEEALDKQNIDFRKSVFAMSGVSGGSVGLGFYNAIAYRDPAAISAGTGKAIDFFSFDSLSPLMAKMLFSEFINLFIPIHIKQFDRAIALEETWEMAYNGIKTRENVFDADFIPKQKTQSGNPMFVINTMEVESGLQCWLSTMQPNGLLLRSKRDLLHKNLKKVKYSTAINFSTRFPLFSPAAAIEVKLKPESEKHKMRYHYLDGGYVENTGTGSMLEILQYLREKNTKDFKKIVPIVISLQFSDNKADTIKNIHKFNDLSEILIGVYNTRAGRSLTAQEELKKHLQTEEYTKTKEEQQFPPGIFIEQPLNNEDVPMNWVLSKSSMNKIKEDIRKKFIDTLKGGVLQQMRVKDLKYLKKKE